MTRRTGPRLIQVTLPILLLGLYVGLLAVSVGLCSWAGHMSPAPDEARRVTDAAERAAIGHLATPSRLAGVVTLVFSIVSGTIAIIKELPAVWFLSAPLLAPLLTGAALFYCGRKLLRTPGQLAGTESSDVKISLVSRVSVGAILCCDATVGLILLGTYSIAVSEMPGPQARFLIYVVGSAIALAAVVFARASVSAHYAASQGSRSKTVEPHPGSLALLVSSTFHAPATRMLGLIVLSTLGHCALLGTAPEASVEQAGSWWLYPHLLKLLGLFGLLFAGLVVRTSEDESGAEGWLRSGAVYLVLMVAGAWSLSSELPEDWARRVPVGLSFLYVALGLSIWIARAHAKDASSHSLGISAYLKMPATALFVGLIIILCFSTGLKPEEGELPSSALLSLLLAGTLAAAPLSFVWLLGRDVLNSSSQARGLAFVESARGASERTAPSERLLIAPPLLSLIVALCALSAGLLAQEPLSGSMVALMGIGGALGALLTGALSGQLERACSKPITHFAALLSAHQAAPPEEAPVNFEAAVTLCRDAIGRSAPIWLLFCLAPAISAALTLAVVPNALFRSLALGIGIGGAILGVGLELLSNSNTQPGRRSIASLLFVACLSQALWLLTAGAFPSDVPLSP